MQIICICQKKAVILHPQNVKTADYRIYETNICISLDCLLTDGMQGSRLLPLFYGERRFVEI